METPLTTEMPTSAIAPATPASPNSTAITSTDRILLASALIWLLSCTCCFSTGLSAQSAEAPTTPQPATSVVVIKGDRLGPDGDAMRERMQRCTNAMVNALRESGIRFSVTTDSAVCNHGVPPSAVAILPYNRAVPDTEVAALREYMQSGGKLLICLLAPHELLEAIAVDSRGTIRIEAPNKLRGMTLRRNAIPGLPARVAQSPEWIHKCRPRAGSRVLGYWCRMDGNSTDLPAVLISNQGAFISAPLLPEGDVDAQAELLRAICGYLAPRIWHTLIPTTEEDIAPLGRYDSLFDMHRKLLIRQRSGEDVSHALQGVSEVVARLDKVRKALRASDYARAMQLGRSAATLAQKAYWMSYPSPAAELRGVWTRNAVPPNWNAAAKRLKAANFNAVFPYICSAGIAWYDSNILPRASQTDYLARAAQAGQRYGLQVHARMLALHTLYVTDDFERKLRSQGRLMISDRGETTDWLCPTQEANRQLLKRLAVEIVTKYPVSGLQFDYMRYPGPNYCFCPACRRAFSEYAGRSFRNLPAAVTSGTIKKKFLQWRRDQITSLIAGVADHVIAARPGIVISAAVFPKWDTHKDTFGQDWKKWVDWDLLDMVCPMNYTASNQTFAGYTKSQIQWVDGQSPICPGIGLNADGIDFGDAQQLVDQITIARNLNAHGWIIFNYDDNLVTHYFPYLAMGATSKPASFDALRAAISAAPTTGLSQSKGAPK